MKDILIVAATKMELPPIEGAVVTGFGKEKTKKILGEVLKRHKPTLIISVGLVGAVTPELKVCDLFIPEVVIDYENLEKKYFIRFPFEKSGILVTVPRVFKKEDKYEIKRELPSATAVDMETSAVAEILEPQGIPLLCIKAVSDELDFDFNNKKLLKENIKTAIESYNRFLCRILKQIS